MMTKFNMDTKPMPKHIFCVLFLFLYISCSCSGEGEAAVRAIDATSGTNANKKPGITPG